MLVKFSFWDRYYTLILLFESSIRDDLICMFLVYTFRNRAHRTSFGFSPFSLHVCHTEWEWESERKKANAKAKLTTNSLQIFNEILIGLLYTLYIWYNRIHSDIVIPKKRRKKNFYVYHTYTQRKHFVIHIFVMPVSWILSAFVAFPYTGHTIVFSIHNTKMLSLSIHCHLESFSTIMGKLNIHAMNQWTRTVQTIGVSGSACQRAALYRWCWKYLSSKQRKLNTRVPYYWQTAIFSSIYIA